MLRTAIATTIAVLSAGGASAQGDVPRGKEIFESKCASCHAVGEEAAKNGPSLNNLLGRPAASLDAFDYSDVMVEAGQGGVHWDVDTLTMFITKPRSVVNGSNMAFTGLRNPDDVANVIAYLATFSLPSAQ